MLESSILELLAIIFISELRLSLFTQHATKKLKQLVHSNWLKKVLYKSCTLIFFNFLCFFNFFLYFNYCLKNSIEKECLEMYCCLEYPKTIANYFSSSN